MTSTADGQLLAELWHTAMTLRQQVAEIAATIAETEDEIADTFDRLARSRPQHAGRLHARATHARLIAARGRHQAAHYSSQTAPPMGSQAAARQADGRTTARTAEPPAS